MPQSEILYDKDIREPLFFWLEENYGKIRILEEKVIGRARADAVMITMSGIYGIEIKSDADTYVRLKKQVRYYDQYYDRNIVVVGSSHAEHIKEHVPKYWGIISVETDENGNADFYLLREASDNPKVKADKKISILWRPELANILARNKMPKYTGKSKAYIHTKLFEKIPEDILWPQVYEELFERDYERYL